MAVKQETLKGGSLPWKKAGIIALIVALLGAVVFLVADKYGNDGGQVTASDQVQAQKVLSGQWTAQDSRGLEQSNNQLIADFQREQATNSAAPVIMQDLKLPPGVKPGSWTKNINGVEVKVTAPKNVAVWIVDDRLFNFAPPQSLSSISWIWRDGEGEIIDENFQETADGGIRVVNGVAFESQNAGKHGTKVFEIRVR